MDKTILIADWHAVYSTGMTSILQKISLNMVIDRVNNEEELIKMLTEKTYDFLIVDIIMLGRSFSSQIKKLKELCPALKVVIFTDTNENLALHYLYEGAAAFIYKSDDASEIYQAFDFIFRKGYYYQQKLLYDFFNTKEAKSFFCAQLDILSAREKQVYHYLLAGLGFLEIANTLGLHQSTVSIYKSRIFKKLNLRTIADLVSYDNIKGAALRN